MKANKQKTKKVKVNIEIYPCIPKCSNSKVSINQFAQISRKPDYVHSDTIEDFPETSKVNKE